MGTKIPLPKKYIWDYEFPKNWQPKKEWEWLWFLERKINYDDWQGLKAKIIKRYFPKLKNHLDPGKRKLLEYYFQKYESLQPHSKKSNLSFQKISSKK